MQVRLILCLWLFVTPLLAETIYLDINKKITASAEFYPGDANKHALLILHGFLLTREFHTVKRLADSLHESGYTVLTPSLSLGINKRKKSLSCEAIHTHNADADLIELNDWVNWLIEKVKKPIVILGHSSGSTLTVDYMRKYQPEEVSQLIYLSLTHYGPSSYANETEQYAQKARQLIRKKDNDIHEFGLSYCKTYPTTAKNYLSYYQYSREYLAQSLTLIKPGSTLIIGSADKRIDQQWNHNLTSLGIDVKTIEGANHFFDYEYEFELLDTVEKILDSI